MVAPAGLAGPLHGACRNDGGHGVEEGVPAVRVAHEVLPSHLGELVPATSQGVVLGLVHPALHGVVLLLEETENMRLLGMQLGHSGSGFKLGVLI